MKKRAEARFQVYSSQFSILSLQLTLYIFIFRLTSNV